jgi:hypothetical protein
MEVPRPATGAHYNPSMSGSKGLMDFGIHNTLAFAFHLFASKN